MKHYNSSHGNIKDFPKNGERDEDEAGSEKQKHDTDDDMEEDEAGD